MVVCFSNSPGQSRPNSAHTLYDLAYGEIRLSIDVRKLRQYLLNYGEPEAGLDLPGVMDRRYRMAMVIPCYDEQPYTVLALLKKLRQLSAEQITILVVNAPIDSEAQALERTRGLWQQLWAAYGQGCEEAERVFPPQSRVKWLCGGELLPDCILVSRCFAGELIPTRQGVGLARKIGADIACRLYLDGSLTQPFLLNTDADVRLPSGYFEAAQEQFDEQTSALIYPFLHEAEPGLEKVSQFYELKLRYYVSGLMSSGSSYAFSTIGSTMAVHLGHYVHVRGFPKKSGGEDFYLLNKLAKVGRVKTLAAPVISITGRESHRVPFGTGPALSKLISLKSLAEAEVWYHPRTFHLLRVWLQEILHPQIWAESSAELFRANFENALPGTVALAERQALGAYGERLGLLKMVSRTQRQFKDPQRYGKAITDWFDGFQTLKFIHYLRDVLLPLVNLRYLLESADFLSSDEKACIRRLMDTDYEWQ